MDVLCHHIQLCGKSLDLHTMLLLWYVLSLQLCQRWRCVQRKFFDDRRKLWPLMSTQRFWLTFRCSPIYTTVNNFDSFSVFTTMLLSLSYISVFKWSILKPLHPHTYSHTPCCLTVVWDHIYLWTLECLVDRTCHQCLISVIFGLKTWIAGLEERR